MTRFFAAGVQHDVTPIFLKARFKARFDVVVVGDDLHLLGDD
jgi:hypothetical protein